MSSIGATDAAVSPAASLRSLIDRADDEFCLFPVKTQMEAEHAMPAVRIQLPEDGVAAGRG